MKMKVVVTPKAAVLDPQGAAVRDAMQHLGMPEVRSVRIGKYLEIEVDDKTPNLDSRLNDLCGDLLSNPVIEDYVVVRWNARCSNVQVRTATRIALQPPTARQGGRPATAGTG